MKSISRVALSLFMLSLGIIANSQTQSSKSSAAKADSLFFAANYSSAKELYRKVLRDTSKNGVTWARYGICNLNLKNYDEALKPLEKALTLPLSSPVRMNAFAAIARVWSVKGNTSKALTNLDSAVSLGYSNLNMLDTNDDFKNVRSEQKFKDVRARVAFPCMADAHAREFDFWIGDWDVYVTGTKTYAGRNRIELIAGGCALLENWDSSSSTGKSLNFIDPVTGKWKQIWTGSYANGIQDFVNGEYKEGAMRFVFEAPVPGGSKVIGRFIFYNEKPGQVRQFNETSSDGGKTWVASYDFTYFLKK